MKQFLSQLSQNLNSRFAFPLEGRFALAVKAFSHRENQIFFTAMGVLVGTVIVMLLSVSRAYTIEVPTIGGTLVEGVLNTPAHINPLLATSEVGTEADRDITALIYSGLLRGSAESGFVPDLAEKYEISKNGLEYTFTLKPNLVWHDGEKITASDVVFTVKTAQDGRMKSPKRANWDGVGVEQIDDLTVRFTLKKPYGPFLENTTMGILPEHIWKTIDYNRFDTNKYNREPIGSGPYKFSKIETVTKDGDEIPVSYTLKAFKSFALGKPRIETMKFVFFGNEESLLQALADGSVEAINSISAENAQKLSQEGFRIEHTPLPRVLAVFFNQNEQPLFTDSSVRKALTLATDKQPIIDKVLFGYGVSLNSPLPPGAVGYEANADEKDRAERLTAARALLEKAGWKFDDTQKLWTKKVKKETQTLHFELATSEATELKTVAQELKANWEELGIPVTVRVFATGDLKETIVRPRKFEALFFGQVLGQGSDPYPFWHSSQRLDPGLNITSYANTKVDKILDEARTEANNDKRATAYKNFSSEVMKDTPAIFMYAPEFLYVLPESVHGLALGAISVPAERFLNIHEWYINTDSVWKIFAEEKK
ncbi:MAG: ABC transporter substrate-binding protein [Candidatus Pacebacteria bacterium]|nr:ABC transporter substrate-binding protein [Candidatus Paceibacterota bacterium]